MNVKQLIDQLKKQDPTAPVYLSSDEEGNAIKLITECEFASSEDGWEDHADGEIIEGVILFPNN
jgi:hypothetical protein